MKTHDFLPNSCVPADTPYITSSSTTWARPQTARLSPSAREDRQTAHRQADHRQADARQTGSDPRLGKGGVVAHETAAHDPQRTLPLTDDPQPPLVELPAGQARGGRPGQPPPPRTLDRAPQQTAALREDVPPDTTFGQVGPALHKGNTAPLQRCHHGPGIPLLQRRNVAATLRPPRKTRRPSEQDARAWKIGKNVKRGLMRQNCRRGCKIPNDRPWRYRK